MDKISQYSIRSYRRTIRDLRKRGQLDGPETPSHSKARGQPCDHSLDNCGLSTARSYPFSLASYSYSKLRDKCKINVRRREARKAVLPPAVRPAPLAGAGFANKQLRSCGRAIPGCPPPPTIPDRAG